MIFTDPSVRSECDKIQKIVDRNKSRLKGGETENVYESLCRSRNSIHERGGRLSLNGSL